MSTQLNLNLSESRIARDEGIQKAITHAESVVPEWSELAYAELKKFLLNYPGEFMAEQFRSHCALVDFPLPPHSRAFGGVFLRAARAGIIEKVRLQQVTNKKAHLCYASVWRRAA